MNQLNNLLPFIRSGRSSLGGGGSNGYHQQHASH
jgi:hypothetical protein